MVSEVTSWLLHGGESRHAEDREMGPSETPRETDTSRWKGRTLVDTFPDEPAVGCSLLLSEAAFKNTHFFAKDE